VEVAGHVFGLERQRPPDLRECPVERTARRQHTDHGVRLAIQRDGTSDYIGIGSEL
jgi:hypothetical protein